MQRLVLALSMLCCATMALAQSGPPSARNEALKGLVAQDPERRALSVEPA